LFSLTTLLLVLVAGAGPAATAAHAETTRELTLDDALSLAKKRNRNLTAERARLAQAETAIASAWSLLLPTVAAQGKYTRNYRDVVFGAGIVLDPSMFPMAVPLPDQLQPKPLSIQPLNQLDAAISFNAPLIVPAAYPGLQSVKANVAAASANLDVSETNVLFAAAQSFYAAAIADEVVATRHSSIDVARATLGNAKTRFAAGTVTKVDVDRAELAMLRVEQLEREAIHGRDQAYRALATLIQAELPFKVVSPPADPQSPSVADGVDNVLHLRPEFRALEMTIEAANKARRTDALKWSPSLSAFGNARRFNYDNFVRDHHSWAVGLQLDWVIYDGGARDAQRHQAEAQAAEAEARALALRDSIRDDLANGRSLLETKKHALNAATRSVALARETLDLVRTQYEAGTVTQVDLLQAQDGLVGAQEALAQSHLDLAVADLALRRAAGTFPPR